MADGVVQFLAEREGEKIRRYIYVPKMRGVLPIDRVIPFTLTEQGILIDPRERYG
jgi:KaiC/GvpD/RAD55 family RecA-like ATPase